MWHTRAMVTPGRISVAASPDTVRALRDMMAAERIGLAEALHRLVGYGEFVHTAVRRDHAELLVRDAGNTREVVLL